MSFSIPDSRSSTPKIPSTNIDTEMTAVVTFCKSCRTATAQSGRKIPSDSSSVTIRINETIDARFKYDGIYSIVKNEDYVKIRRKSLPDDHVCSKESSTKIDISKIPDLLKGSYWGEWD